MIKPINISPDQIINEIGDYHNKLAKWVDGLSRAEPLQPYQTEHSCVYTHGKFRILRYTTGKPSKKPPLLICYALVNRPSILDLQPDRSLIQKFLAQGLEVYLIDWGYPDRTDRYMELSGYIDFVDVAVKLVAGRHKTKPALLGICQGGTLSLCHAALHPDSISKLITMITPVDFSTEDNTLGKWVQDLDVNQLVRLYGNIPGGFLNSMFVNLKPFLLGKQKYIDALAFADEPDRFDFFRRMEHWINDSPDLAGNAFREFVQLFYQSNLFFNDKALLAGQKIDLSKIQCDVLNIYATQDHIVPPSASIPLVDLIGSKNYDTATFETGHIGIYVSHRCTDGVGKAIGEWIPEI